MELTLQVVTHHYCAGSVWRKNGAGVWVCVEAAPIMRWMVGKEAEFVRAWLERTRWGYRWLNKDGETLSAKLPEPIPCPAPSSRGASTATKPKRSGSGRTRKALPPGTTTLPGM